MRDVNFMGEDDLRLLVKQQAAEIEAKIDIIKHQQEWLDDKDAEIERLKEENMRLSGESDLVNFPTADEADKALENLKQALAAQQQKGQDNETV